MKRFIVRRLFSLMSASGLVGLSSCAFASGFQLWEQDGASVANYHAGYAALATDASIAFYNPAGITRIHNQQLVLGGAAIMTSFKYAGTIQVNTLGPAPLPTVAQGGTFSFVPNLHYAAPISDCIGFGFSVAVPFGLKTDFGRSTSMRYAATRSALYVINISPSLGFKVSDKASLGFGVDFQKVNAQFDQVGVAISPIFDTNLRNHADDTGWGYHFGGLYEMNPCTRFGFSYHSQVVHHLTGSSKFAGPLADLFNDGPIRSSDSKAKLTLPPYAALSAYHQFHPQYAVMGSVIYTKWTTFQTLTLQNVAGLEGGEPSSTIVFAIPQHYRNTWNATVGLDYYASPQMILRGGIGYDETPVRNRYRNPPLPDNNRYVVALGGHYQANKCIGFDLGWSHFFLKQARVTPPVLVGGDQEVTVSGHSNGGGDVIGAQITWNMT